ncbi:MAG TPA: DUF2079 domain-containing protein [Gaiellaceae bacterium]
MTAARTLLAAAVAAFAAGFGALAVLQHRAYTTGRFDLGNLTQAVWSTAHGELLELTDVEGRQISRLGAHFDPIVAAFAPAWRLWPDPSLLLITQAVAVGLGAVPVFLLARKHLGSAWAGLGFALVYLLYPPTQWLVLDDFHPVALATPLLLLAFWFLDEGRLGAFAVAAGLACTTKEQVGFTVAAMGLWYAFARSSRRAGFAIAVAGATAAMLAISVVVPHFAPGGGSPFAGRYDRVGGSPAGIVETTVTDPGAVAGELAGRRDLAYLRDLLLPLGALPLLAPPAALTAAPELAANMLSETATQTSIRYHYTAAAIPGLVAAAVFGAAALRRRLAGSGRVVPRVAVVVALGAGVVLGPMPLWRHVPLGATAGATDHVAGAHARAAARALRHVPPGAPVSATNTLGAHLSERRRVFGFPVVKEARWIVVDTRRPSFRDQADAPARSAAALDRLRSDPRWRLVFEEGGIVVLHRS